MKEIFFLQKMAFDVLYSDLKSTDASSMQNFNLKKILDPEIILGGGPRLIYRQLGHIYLLFHFSFFMFWILKVDFFPRSYSPQFLAVVCASLDISKAQSVQGHWKPS